MKIGVEVETETAEIAEMNPEEWYPLLKREAVTQLPELPFARVASGKVREIFALDADRLLMITTDRISAFDVIMREGVPGKGALLTQMSLYWFEQVAPLVRHHLVDDHAAAVAEVLKDFPELQPRAMVVRKLQPLPIEAIVRGYLAGSGWKDYRSSGTLFGLPVPSGLLESGKLPEPLFTPSTKAQSGHDEPISAEDAAKLIGAERFAEVERLAKDIYAMGAAKARSAGIILADTKFEFGTDKDGGLVLIDEVLTPDSSRYWPRDTYHAGKSQPSYDKQFVRDFLETCDWDKTPPPPALPPSVIQGTQERYRLAFERICL